MYPIIYLYQLIHFKVDFINHSSKKINRYVYYGTCVNLATNDWYADMIYMLFMKNIKA